MAKQWCGIVALDGTVNVVLLPLKDMNLIGAVALVLGYMICYSSILPSRIQSSEPLVKGTCLQEQLNYRRRSFFSLVLHLFLLEISSCFMFETQVHASNKDQILRSWPQNWSFWLESLRLNRHSRYSIVDMHIYLIVLLLVEWATLEEHKIKIRGTNCGIFYQISGSLMALLTEK